MGPQKKLRALDLFTGIGGTHLSLSSITTPVAYCEIDKKCVDIIQRRLPRAPIFPDVTKLTAKDLRLLLASEPQLITASFPCQDVSVAGRGEGLGRGTRSSLVFDVFRLVDELGPSSVELIFLENSPAIRTRGLDQVLEACRQRGFDRVVWTYASARDVGAHHMRKRFFLLASRASPRVKIPTTPAWDGFAFRDSSVPRLKPRGDQAACALERKRVSALGNAVVPAALAAAWNTLARALNDDDAVPGVREVFLPSPRARHMKKTKKLNLSFVLPDGSKKECDTWTTPVHHPSHWYPRSRYEGRTMRSLATQVFHERGTQRTFGFRNVQLGRRRFSLNPEWVEALMGFPRGWTDVTKNNLPN